MSTQAIEIDRIININKKNKDEASMAKLPSTASNDVGGVATQPQLLRVWLVR